MKTEPIYLSARREALRGVIMVDKETYALLESRGIHSDLTRYDKALLQHHNEHGDLTVEVAAQIIERVDAETLADALTR
jgi:hypothetical protein